MRSTTLQVLAAAAVLAPASSMASDWLQFGFDEAHSGNNTAETTITAANVSTLTKLYEITLPATADNQPILLSAVSTSSGTKDLLFLVLKNGELMALDAATGNTVWHSTPTGSSTITTSTPAIDPGRQFVYAYDLDGKVHKYGVSDGSEVTTGGWPELITNKPIVEKGAAGLSIATIAGGAVYLYVVTDGYGGDNGDYQGHIVTINLGTGAQSVFNAQCSNLQIHLVADQSAGALGVTDCPQVFTPFQGSSGIWGRPGAIYDAGTNRVFMASGNGIFDARDTVFRSPFEPMSSGFNFGDSVFALNADGTSYGQMPVDSYTPSNYASLQSSDLDLGSASPALLPAPAASKFQHLAVQGGKDAKLRLLNLANLSGFGAPGFVSGSGSPPVTSELQILNVPQGNQVKPQPAVWVDGGGATWVFVATGNGLSALKLTIDGSGNPSLVSQWAQNKSSSTTSPTVANGIVFAANGTHVIALDPTMPNTSTSSNTLWTSDAISAGFHWQALTVVNGCVYVPDNGGNLWAFALP
jgi:hypothetical protein